jgi:protein-disulfide isomerase
MTKLRLLPVLAVALFLAACSRSPAALAADDPEFGEKVRAYLLANPQVIEEAILKLQEQKRAQAGEAQVGAINANRDAIERDPRDFVANPNGKITVTEFFDYRCGYCKVAAPEINRLIRENPDIRFVFKEFVIFGAESEAAARAALGARSQGKYLDIHNRFMAEKSLDQAAVRRLLAAGGADVASAEAAGRTEAVSEQLLDVRELAQTLGIQGTPAFVVGEVIVPGADMKALTAAIDKARKGA